MEPKLNILQVSTRDLSGGAERVAYSLMQMYRDLGHTSRLAVGSGQATGPDVIRLPNEEKRNPAARLFSPERGPLRSLCARSSAIARAVHYLYYASQPARALNIWRGHEDFDYPGARNLPGLTAGRPDIVHCHNLHGDYFDLRELPRISSEVPVVITLHDNWLLSGHCAHPLGCERWKSGCGHCPDLTIYPSIRRDATARNYQIKADIFRRSRLYVAAPCQWVLERATRSMLSPGIVESRIVPNGIDLDTFHPSHRDEARKRLGLPRDAKILLFTANGIRKNIWKDYETIRKAVAEVADARRNEKILFLALGEDAPPEKVGSATIVFVPYQSDQATVASYYQAADVYMHAARADTFPNTIIEAMACGLPIVATDTGGISEQIDDGRTGFLTPMGDPQRMADSALRLISDGNLARETGDNAAKKAAAEYSLVKSARSYLDWYRTIIDHP